MVKYICEICNKNFTRKSDLIYHTEKKKKPCQPINQILPNMNQNRTKLNQTEPKYNQTEPEFLKIDHCTLIENKLINCNHCLKTFVNISSLKRHLNGRCKVKKLENEKKENIFNNLIEKEKINNILYLYEEQNNLIQELKKNNEDLNKKNEELNKKIEEVLKKNIGNTQNITTNNTQIININNPNKINPFGKESYDKLNKKDILKIMTDIKNNGKHCFNKLIDLIHFNVNIPENQNIYMGDYNRGKFMVHDGTNWNLSQNEEFIIFQVLEHVRKLFFSKIDDEEFEQKFEKDQVFRNEFNTTFKKYYDYIYDEVEDAYLTSKELQKKKDFKELMNNEVKNKLYNKKKFVLNTYEKNKHNLLI